MKKFVTITVVSAALALTAGCGGATSSSSNGAPTVADSAAATPGPTSSVVSASPSGTHVASEFAVGKMPDADFAALVRKQTTLAAFSDADLSIMSQTACAALANGGATQASFVGQVIKSSSQPTFDITAGAGGKDFGFLLGAGTSNYCPDSSSALAALFPAS